VDVWLDVFRPFLAWPAALVRSVPVIVPPVAVPVKVPTAPEKELEGQAG
jgi:hypothetical protein